MIKIDKKVCWYVFDVMGHEIDMKLCGYLWIKWRIKQVEYVKFICLLKLAIRYWILIMGYLWNEGLLNNIVLFFSVAKIVVLFRVLNTVVSIFVYFFWFIYRWCYKPTNIFYYYFYVAEVQLKVAIITLLFIYPTSH